MTAIVDTALALAYFKKNDQIMARLLAHSLEATAPIAIPQPKKPTEYFGSIVSSIISQQISTAAARSIKARVVSLLKELTPEAVLAADFATLKACGLSEKKTQYLKHNAEVWHEIPVRNFVHMTDEEVIAELTKLYGVGRWTAEMFLLFSLARKDVFSFGDLGLMNSLYKHYQLKPHFVRKIRSTVENWSPHRSVASLALWHTIDNGPVLL
ncbi:MAG: DNA-3-methyladenine glycosylase 2 family protein [Patescibacteria group bacterium]